MGEITRFTSSAGHTLCFLKTVISDAVCRDSEDLLRDGKWCRRKGGMRCQGKNNNDGIIREGWQTSKSPDARNNDICGYGFKCWQFNGDCAKVMRVIFEYNMGKVRFMTHRVLMIFE